MGDNCKTTLKSGKDYCQYLNFRWTLPYKSTPPLKCVFACMFRPAGCVNGVHIRKSDCRHNNVRCEKECLWIVSPSWSVRLMVVLSGTHSVHCLFFFRDGKFLLEAVGIFSLSKYSWSVGLQIVLISMVCSVCFYLWWEILVRSSWDFQLVQIFLISWIDDCFVRHSWCALSVLIRNYDGKFLLEAVGISACPNILDQLD